jgi:hypothetical protein
MLYCSSSVSVSWHAAESSVNSREQLAGLRSFGGSRPLRRLSSVTASRQMKSKSSPQKIRQFQIKTLSQTRALPPHMLGWNRAADLSPYVIDPSVYIGRNQCLGARPLTALGQMPPKQRCGHRLIPTRVQSGQIQPPLTQHIHGWRSLLSQSWKHF